MLNTQIGEVIAVEPGGRTVTVEIKRAGACSHGGCSHQMFQAVDMNVRVRAANAARAQLGDFVQVSFETRGALWAAFLVYIVPVVIGLVVYGIAGALAAPYPGIVGLAAAAITLFIGLKKGDRVESDYTAVRRLDPDSILWDQYSCQNCPFH
ncbi:MAG: SoxR reducing system RseC family protein [Limnochordia bacterium]|jgi:positive regulator of sigma E activity